MTDLSGLSGLSVIKIPTIYKVLLEYHPYVTLYGGRNAGKDYNVVRTDLAKGMLYNKGYTEEDIAALLQEFRHGYNIDAKLLERCLRNPCRFLYCREVMESIKRSSYTTIKDAVAECGLEKWWSFRDDRIICVNGSEIFFAGLYRDPHNIKSIEGVTDCRVVEAENVSEESWKNLVPTIRKELSTIVISFNTRYVDDPTYVRWVENPPKGTKVVKVNSTDIEGYLTEQAKRTRDEDYRLRRWEYDNVWRGEPLAAGQKLYPHFREEVHCKDFDWKWVKLRANLYMACDPASNHYPACLWAARFRDETGELITWIYNEYPKFEQFGDYFHKIRKTVVFTGTIQDLADDFCRGDQLSVADIRNGINIRKRFIDTRFTRGSGQSNYMNQTRGLSGEFARAGIDFDEPDITIIDVQKERLQEDLQYNPDAPIGAMNHPRLYIHPACTNLIMALKNHRLEEKTDREHEKWKDMIDALRILYAGMAEYPFIDPNAPKAPYQRRQGGGGKDSWLSA